MNFLLFGQEYAPCSLCGQKGQKLWAEQVEWGYKYVWYIFKTGMILPIFQMRKLRLMEVELFVRGHTTSKCNRRELGTRWD